MSIVVIMHLLLEIFSQTTIKFRCVLATASLSHWGGGGGEFSLPGLCEGVLLAYQAPWPFNSGGRSISKDLNDKMFYIRWKC